MNRYSSLMTIFSNSKCPDMIQYKSNGVEWIQTEKPTWDIGIQYRVNPTSDYAISKIKEFGGARSVVLYLHWINGGSLRIFYENFFKYDWRGHPIENNSRVLSGVDSQEDWFYQFAIILKLKENGDIKRIIRIASQNKQILVEK